MRNRPEAVVMCRFLGWIALGAVLFAGSVNSAAAVEVRVDCSQRLGVIRALHGVNNGPVNSGQMIDLSSYYRALEIPLARLHDSEWPNPDVVDIHAIFPDLRFDPKMAENYHFSRTDDYIKAIVDTGTAVVYRLGESIEWTSKKYNVAPPSDYEKWTQVCLGIIRHYNDGWADGYHHKIRYWEIWNEPENRPNMWTGTDEDYYRLYGTAAKAIKAEFPDLMVGGPSAGAQGELIDGRIEPYPFLKGFLEYCRDNATPLDFFSWHTYTNDPYLYVRKAKAMRRLLDEYGFAKAELHLNEWNYLPDNDWTPLSLSGQGLNRRDWFARIGGTEGAAFLACVLVYLQESPVDVANYYAGDTNWFGLFGRFGEPRKNFYAVKAFRMLLDTPIGVKVSGNRPGESAVCAGINRDETELTVLVSNFRCSEKEYRFGIDHFVKQGKVAWEILRVDSGYNLERVRSDAADGMGFELNEVIEAPCVVVLRVRSANN
ncbi:MAG: hypothetical protein JXN61_13715 [Sedimentisphaerales bacterium]|nr:hypothetical protein [Sedimentisphaerales bacterium]